MLCEEKIINVFLGMEEYPTKGANCWFDCYDEIAFHTTEGFRIVLETENHMLSLLAGGVMIQNKMDFTLSDNEYLEKTVDIFEWETENGIEKDIFVDFKSTLFVGQRLLQFEEHDNYYVVYFDDFSLKLYQYELGKMELSFHGRDDLSYSRVLGFDRLLKAKCPHCGGDGAVMLDHVYDFMVVCKSCKRSTMADMQIRYAIEDWNNGEVQCDLSDIIVD